MDAGPLGTSWQGWLTVAVAAALTVAGVVLLVRSRRRRPHPSRVRTAAGVAACLVLALVTAGLTAAVGTGYATDWRALATLGTTVVDDPPAPLAPGVAATPPHATTAATGATWEVTVPSTARGVPSGTAWVHVPPGYSQHPTARYPVLYLLHGSPGTSADWFAAGHLDEQLDRLVDDGTLPPVVAVAPDLDLGVDDEPVDLPAPGALRGTYLTADVVPWADAHLRTLPERAERAVVGMSAGGFGALVLGLAPDAPFAGVVSLMPYLRPGSPALRRDPTALAAVSPLDVVARATTAPPVYLGVPSADGTHDGRLLADALARAGIPHVLREVDGDHDWASVQRMSPAAVTWVARQLGWGAPGEPGEPGAASGAAGASGVATGGTTGGATSRGAAGAGGATG